MRLRMGAWTTAALMATGVVASAHEFIAKPGAMSVGAGAALPIAGLSSHVFMVSEELEDAGDVRLGVFADGKRLDVPFKANQQTLSYDGVATAPSAATFIVTGLRLPQIWGTTPEGLKPTTKKTPGSSSVFRIEKFSKAIVNGSATDAAFSTVVGDALEIVPVDNPAAAKPGDEITVKVLFRGQPLATNIYATYDGFSKQENTYAYFTEGRGDGTAKIKLTQPGLWMVRVQHSAPERTDDYDRYVGRAVLLFEVK